MKNEKLSIEQLTTAFSNIQNEKEIFVISDIINNISNQVDEFLNIYENSNKSIIAGFAETHTTRKKRLLAKYPKPLNYLYYTGDFILTRVSPKLKLTQELYQFLSNGKGYVLSKTEILGMLYYAGFEILDEVDYQHKWYFIVRRKENHTAVNYTPKKGLLINLPRIGKNGKIIQVYKLRTMHPYAEFIQEYVHQKNDLQEGGKLKDDFRISTIGRFLRKYWLDEMPMIINMLKGEMKLIGVRPLSAHYMSLYTDELQQLRTQTKPGLLPPFYADNPTTLEEIQESEKRYLLAHKKNPILTDFQYFFKILNNILLKGKRSA